MVLAEFLSSLPPGTGLGFLAAAIFSLGVGLLYVSKKYSWGIAALIIVVITPLAIGGFWFSSGELGISDWDYYFSYHHVLYQSIVEHHTFPLWNPYTCGGTAGLADPEFPVISLTFLFELVLGVEKGLRAAIFLSVAGGALGMLALSKRLQLSVWAGLAAAIGFAFGSVNLLEIVEGHQNIFAAMWIPWVFYSWYAAYQEQNRNRETGNKKLGGNLISNFFFLISRPNIWTMWCAVFLALTFYAAGIYLLMYTAIAFIGLLIVAKRRKAALVITLTAGVVALGLSAFKLIPVFLWLSQFQDQVYASSTLTLTHLHKILLGRYLHGAENIIPNQGGGWHEYGAYLGPFIIGLAVLAITTIKKSRLVRLLVLASVAALLISSSGPLVKPLFDHAGFLPRSNISRFILFAIIPLCLLAGIGLDRLQRFSFTGKKVVIHGLLTLIAIDLMTLSYPLSLQAFVLPYNEKPVPPAPLPIAYTAFEYKTRFNEADYTRAYEAVKAGYGSLSYCAVLGPPPAVRTIHDEIDKDILSVKTKSETFGSYNLTFWNPNTAIGTVTLPEAGSAVLNANYAKGWFVNGLPAKPMWGRPGIDLPAGTHQVTFRYRTPGLPTGLTVSLITLSALLYALIKRQRIR